MRLYKKRLFCIKIKIKTTEKPRLIINSKILVQIISHLIKKMLLPKEINHLILIEIEIPVKVNRLKTVLDSLIEYH